MHTGRISHPSNTPHGRRPIAPSAVKPEGKMLTAYGPLEMPEPRALSTEEVAGTVRDFRRAAGAAVEAGADGVGIHEANGYPAQRFLSSNANRRDDRYGGSIPNRIRFAVEVASAVAEEIGAGRTGVRVSPGNPFNDVVEDDVPALYRALLDEELATLVAYLHLLHGGDEDLLRSVRRDWTGVLVLNRVGGDERGYTDYPTLRETVTAGAHAA